MDKYELPEDRIEIVDKKIKNFKLKLKNLKKKFLKKKGEIMMHKSKKDLFGSRNQDDNTLLETSEKNYLYEKAKMKLYNAQDYTMSISTELDRNSKTMKNTLNNVF
jgi:hypothetical protein